MAFDEVQFPPAVSGGATVEIVYRNMAREWHSGGELTTATWQYPLRAFAVDDEVRLKAAATTVLGFYRARGGPEDGFRFRDPTDWTTDTRHDRKPSETTSADTWVGLAGNLHHIGCANGSSGQTFQLRKWYRHGGYERVRPITKPTLAGDPSNFQYFFAQGAEGSGVKLTSWTLNRTTGVVTINTAIPVGWEILWSGTFDVPAQFDPSTDESILEELATAVDPSGVTPAAARMTALRFLEMPMGNTVEDAIPRQAMGAATKTFNVSQFYLSMGDGQFQVLKPTSPAANVYLPNSGGLAHGGPHLFLINDGPATVALKQRSSEATVVTSFAPNTSVECYVTTGGQWRCV